MATNNETCQYYTPGSKNMQLKLVRQVYNDTTGELDNPPRTSEHLIATSPTSTNYLNYLNVDNTDRTIRLYVA